MTMHKIMKHESFFGNFCEIIQELVDTAAYRTSDSQSSCFDFVNRRYISFFIRPYVIAYASLFNKCSL